MTEEIETLLKESRLHRPSAQTVANAYVKDYDTEYKKSIADPQGFWSNAARELEWFSPWHTVLEWNYPWAKWFVGATCNIAYNCLDRHVRTWRKNKVALIWVGEHDQERIFTYAELYRQVNRCANALKKLGIAKGDRVTIYLPKIPEQMIAMLACARIGAIHSVVYSGFSAPALASRIHDAESKAVITADVGFDRGKTIPLKSVVDEALKSCPTVNHVVIVRRQPSEHPLSTPKELDWHEWIRSESAICPAEPLDAEAPLYILYTSGTTGKPKGVVHVHGGYMVGTYITTKYVFDLKDDDVYFCVADPGWVTGHSYIVYGPLLNGATILTAEGKPDYPTPGRWWDLIERYGVSIFYTTPTAIRLLMRYGEEWPAKYDLSSLRILGSVGEPINPEAWEWFHRVTGGDKPVMDTWWQTETGAILVTPLPSMPLKPGSAAKPFLGVEADVVDREGNSLLPNVGGLAVIKKPWPSMMRTIYKDPERYQTYWNTIPNCYTAGDVCHKDEDGYFWFMGRADDVIKVAGNRLGTAEVESALVSHPAIAEAAVIGKPHKTVGESIKAFIILKQGEQDSPALIKSIKDHVLKELGKIAVPSEIDIVSSLPKTRSGKIMRRVLKAKELGQDPGDLSTIEE
ncbi:acetate--CoA ligase [Candidatus Nitrospira inopinata]|jgi:acetyl-CoA synthetase|uniref:Acetate--CoA ligase n=1 Tax=Candidatus Nitrospira inopinata TaxID=1715989 RepID=A0A0S4KXB3_9BACT|nr:acetate--CoA ligase [Candidatus Nitrospira inopinata]CUQ67158.1 Acetyl-CoA synthetase [Candidatus Nitrospira inopinata]